jgi:hypothetical protein
MIDKIKMQEYSAMRKLFAKLLDTTEAYVQKGNDEIIEFCKANESQITAEQLVTLASDENKILHKFFNWQSTPEERLLQAKGLLAQIPFLVGSDNKYYDVTSEDEV